MVRIIRSVIVVCCLFISLQAFMLWTATGRKALTRFPTEELTQQADSGLSDLFSDTGLNDDLGEVQKLDNRFTFGLLPSPAANAEAVSLMTVAGPALLVALLAIQPIGWSKRKSHHKNDSE